jgi:hypothetical protein
MFEKPSKIGLISIFHDQDFWMIQSLRWLLEAKKNSQLAQVSHPTFSQVQASNAKSCGSTYASCLRLINAGSVLFVPQSSVGWQ